MIIKSKNETTRVITGRQQQDMFAIYMLIHTNKGRALNITQDDISIT